MTAEFRVDNKIELLLHVWEKVVLMAMNREKGVQSELLFHAISFTNILSKWVIIYYFPLVK